MSQAEQAAKQGDQRALFLVARRLAPRSHRGTVRLQDSSGRPLGTRAAMQAIVAYSNTTFAASPDSLPQLPLTGTLLLGSQTFSAALSKLNVRKAVPGHCAPAASWRLCSACISDRLGPLLSQHFAAGSQSTLVGDLRDAHVVWLEKPNKPPTSVTALRPIGLMPPCAKAIAAALAQQIQARIQPLLDHMPQYAYSPRRGCNDAILRVHQHFEQVERLQHSQASNRFQMRLGVPRLRCYGGLCLSLDLSKAFDSVCRNKLTQSLLDHGIPNDVVSAVQQLHKSARYVFRLDRESGQTLTTCGIKQGCRAAPTLWLCLTLSILEVMLQHRSLEWIQRVLTIFADDFCGCWTIESTGDLLRAISDLELVLSVLAEFQLTVNLQKTALLLDIKGSDAKKILQSRTVHKQGVPHLRIQVQGQDHFLKICDSHTYLGTKLAYKHRRDLNVAHRISAAQHRYQQIRKVLNGRNPLSSKHRLRLWVACINSSLLYSLEAVGCSLKGLRKLYTLATRHLRAILKQPAHLSHVTNTAIWTAAVQLTPEQHIYLRMQRFRVQRDPNSSDMGPDIVCNDTVLQQICSLILQHSANQSRLEMDRAAPQATGSDLEPVAGIPCPHCHQDLPTQHALRIHIGLHHKDQLPEKRGTIISFSAPLHAVDGMPTCRLCRRSFTTWRQLKLHIGRGSCPNLGGSSFLLHPPDSDNHHLRGPEPAASEAVQPKCTARPPPETAMPDASDKSAAYTPLVLQPSFHACLDNWEVLLTCRETKAQLSCRCVLCGMWVAMPKHMKQHYNKTHHHLHPDLREATAALCTSFKRQFTRNRSCKYCGTLVGAASRHTVQCTVLHQLCLATIYCQRGLHRQDTHDTGVRDLCSLHAVRTAGDQAGTQSGGQDLAAAEATASGTRAPIPASGTTQAVRAELVRTEPSPAASTDAHGPHPPAGQQTPSEARSHPGESTPGQEFCSLLSARRAQLAAQPHAGVQGMARKTGSGRHVRDHALKDSAHGMSAEGATCPAPASDLHSRGQNVPPTGPVDQRRRFMELLKVVPQGTPPAPRREQGARDPHGGDKNAEQPPRSDVRYHNPTLSVDAASLATIRARTPAGDLPTGDCPSGHRGGGHLDPLSVPVRVSHHQPGRLLDEGGRPTKAAPGQGTGQSDVCGRPVPSAHAAPIPPPNPANTTADNQVESARTLPRIPSVEPPADNTSLRTNHPHTHLFPSLHNPGNHCYMNALIYSLLALEQHTDCTLLPPTFSAAPGRSLSAYRALGFCLLGWGRPHSQHDIVEFADFLLPKLLPDHRCVCWHARRLEDGAVRVLDSAALNRCLSLSQLEVRHSDIQQLLFRWHHQSALHALAEQAPWVLVQLPRTSVIGSTIAKRRDFLSLAASFRVPIFAGAGTLETTWHCYQPLALVIHHGDSFRAGHYTTLISDGAGHFSKLDDDRAKRRATPIELNHASHNAYLLLLVLHNDPSPQRLDSQDLIVERPLPEPFSLASPAHGRCRT